MHALLWLLGLTVVVCAQAAVQVTGPEARSVNSNANSNAQQASTGVVGVMDSVLRGKSRQSRCVRCYEDRDRDRYYGSYASRSVGDDYLRGGGGSSSAWYYSGGYDDRSSGRDRDYDRYYDRSRYYDDRYSPRSYDRYESRGAYDDYRSGGLRDRGYGYDNRDRYYTDRYSDNSRDRYYDRSRSSYDRYDPYDRYYARYDFRNYRPWDETYRGQSGFDNSGRGYYFATDEDSYSPRPHSNNNNNNNNRDRGQSLSSCGSCSYGGGTRISSAHLGSHSLGSEGKGWTYLGGEQDKPNSGSSSSSSTSSSSSSSLSSSSSSSSSSPSSGNSSGSSRDRERDRERDMQSSPYGGRTRPLGVSYLMERDSNSIVVSDGQASNANHGGGGGSVVQGEGMPAPAAQTASSSGSSEGESQLKPDTGRQ